MLKSWLRDLQWRKRRFLVATVGAGLLFGVTLSTTGISSGFDVEVTRTVAQLRVDHWVVGQGAVGPFLGSAPMAASRVAEIAALPGVRRAVPTVYTRKDILSSGKPKDVNVFGAPPGALALPQVTEGRAPRRAGEIAISTKLAGYGIGRALVLAGHRLRVVGRVADSTSLAGVPNVFLTLRDAQRVAFNGQPVASAITIDGTVRGAVPAGLKMIGNAAAREDLLRALEQARKSIYLTAILSWVVAAMIIGSVIYLSVTERLRDFAVFKAIGISTRSIVVGLSFEALLVSAGAAIVGSVVAAVLGPNLSLPVSISWRAYMLLPAIALVVGLGASLIGVRKAVRVDPAAAFRGTVMPGLAIRDLTIEYTGGGGYVVRPIDELVLDVAPGSLVLLLGPSGCGKTSLLAALGAILTPTSGSIRFGDTEVTDLSGGRLTEYRRHTVGIVFQAFNLVASLSAMENVTLPMLAAGVDARTAEARAGELLDGLGLSHRRRHHPGDMSGGEQQRVALARALALEPQLILADEPTAHLDYLQVETLLHTLRELASGERIVVVATHDHRLIPLADQIVELVPDVGATNEPPETEQFPAGAVIFEQNSWGSRIYVIEDGEVEILVEHADGTSEQKAVVTAGSYFGEMGPLFNFPRTATARARTDVTLTAYGVRDFRSLIASDSLPAGVPPGRGFSPAGGRRAGLVELLAAHPFRRHAGRSERSVIDTRDEDPYGS